MNARLRHALITTTIVIVVILLAGATYQGVATALDRRNYPRPGGLVSVGDHQLHIYCTGTGSPVVVLEAAASGISAGWGWVQPAVAHTTRVCSYDRSGLGWSEAGDRPFDPGRVPEELHTLLSAAGEQPPYVIAGHSLGASFAKLYAHRYSNEVAGLVLIDPASGAAPGDRRFLTLSPWLARTGVLRATGLLSNNAEGLPEPAAGAVSAFLNRPDHLTRASREVARWDDAVRLGNGAAAPNGVLVSVVRVGDENRLAMLNDQEVARRVAAAIVAVVKRVRQSAGTARQ